MVEGNVACDECVDVHLIPLPKFIILGPLHVRFSAVDIAEGLWGLEDNCVGIHTDFASLNNVNGMNCYGGRSCKRCLPWVEPHTIDLVALPDPHVAITFDSVVVNGKPDNFAKKGPGTLASGLKKRLYTA